MLKIVQNTPKAFTAKIYRKNPQQKNAISSTINKPNEQLIKKYLKLPQLHTKHQIYNSHFFFFFDNFSLHILLLFLALG